MKYGQEKMTEFRVYIENLNKIFSVASLQFREVEVKESEFTTPWVSTIEGRYFKSNQYDFTLLRCSGIQDSEKRVLYEDDLVWMVEFKRLKLVKTLMQVIFDKNLATWGFYGDIRKGTREFVPYYKFLEKERGRITFLENFHLYKDRLG